MLKSKMLKFLYLFLLICGFLLFSIGLFFHLLRWPDMFHGIYIGPVFFILGMIILISVRIKK